MSTTTVTINTNSQQNDLTTPSSLSSSSSSTATTTAANINNTYRQQSHSGYANINSHSIEGSDGQSSIINNTESTHYANQNQNQYHHLLLPMNFSASLSNYDLIEIKSKFEAEFRRFSLQRSEITNLEDFIKLIEHFHKLFSIPFCLFYTDPNHGDLLPINNDTNFALAIASAKPLLRLIVQRKGESIDYLNSYGKKKTNFLGNILPGTLSSSSQKNRLAISAPEDFRQVSSIIDVDIVPETCRRVRLVKHGSDKPLGFYIRDGSSFRLTEHGMEKVPGIFISRLVPGGLAESTGLLAVNDEVLEVNGIEVNGKSLDQVTDMMVANSSNLIITIRPANQGRAQSSSMYHCNLSSSFSSNTISNYHHPGQSGDIIGAYTNSLERSGHRSKVANYNQQQFHGTIPHHYSNNASYLQQYGNNVHHRPELFINSPTSTVTASSSYHQFRHHPNSFQQPHLLNSHHHHHHHAHQQQPPTQTQPGQQDHDQSIVSIQQRVDDEEDDDDEDEVRDHFANNNAHHSSSSSSIKQRRN